MYLITDNKIKDFDFEKASKCNDNISFVSVLCSNRVSQMTKTYNDIEAVTRLLEEVNFDLHFLEIFKKGCFFQNIKLFILVSTERERFGVDSTYRQGAVES